jgi:hypothetical protein
MPGLGRPVTISLLLVCGSLGARDYGPPIGSKMPGFKLSDQDGKTHTLASLLGPKGAVILFFRSADW